ncbi:hypothetical protein EMCRGX_G020272 [Ephydatia muelleri]
MPRFRAQVAYELSEGTLYPLQTFKKGIDNPEMNLGGIYQLDKDTDASFQDGSDKEDDDTSVESDSSAVLMILILLLVLFWFLISRTILTKMIFLPHHGGRNTTLTINVNDINGAQKITICGAYCRVAEGQPACQAGLTGQGPGLTCQARGLANQAGPRPP